MLLLSRVCAEFHDRTGATLFTVTPRMRLTFQEAPESIRQDPLFTMLLNDHSIEVADDTARKKQLENNPEALPVTPEPVDPIAPSSEAETQTIPKPSPRKPAEKKG